MVQDMRYLVDGHVHYYPEFDFQTFFGHALRNLAMNNRKSATKQPFVSFLMLTEAKQHDYFADWQQTAGQERPGTEFTFRRTKEPFTLSLHQGLSDAPLAYVVRGRQVVTKENLEILTLASTQTIPDGLPATEVIQRSVDQGELAVLAWGVGKWLFDRGLLVDRLVDSITSPGFLLGDNSARPWFWLRPRVYRQDHVTVISGSDPLPFRTEASKVGRYGFYIDGPFDSDKPAESLVKRLSAAQGDSPPVFFGRRDGLFSFLSRQARVNGRKHFHLG